MIRKIAFALAATVALGTAAVTVDASPAAAWGWKKHHHHLFWRGAFRVYTPALVGYRSCYVKRVVLTAWGARVRVINRCI